ncbi:MAG TPA: FMN-binding protein [Patescibacteria group bacterium]
MKKVLLSGIVIGMFILYGLHQRGEAENAVVVPPQQFEISPTSTLTTPVPESASSTPPTSGATSMPTLQPTARPSGQYKDGSYTGSAADAFYGFIQVKAVITNGKISDVVFLQYPNDRGTSVMINQQAMPYLKQEALAVQNANVDIVSGATDSSIAFRQSLASALSQAK